MTADQKKMLRQIPLADFFRERVQEALAHQQVAASALLEFYLVNLLQEFRKTEKLFEKEGSRMQEKPLALLLAQAIEGNTNTKIRCLKQLGDLSLYTAGFFKESIRRKIIDIHYYIGMGGSAYGALSHLLNNQKTFCELYSELSQLFPTLVDVLSFVASSTGWQTNRDLLKIYERWITTGDERLETLLNEAGIATQDHDIFNKPQ